MRRQDAATALPAGQDAIAISVSSRCYCECSLNITARHGVINNNNNNRSAKAAFNSFSLRSASLRILRQLPTHDEELSPLPHFTAIVKFLQTFLASDPDPDYHQSFIVSSFAHVPPIDRIL